MRVENVPSYAYDDPFIVCRECDNELWFWGSFEDLRTACKVAQEISGQVVETASLI